MMFSESTFRSLESWSLIWSDLSVSMPAIWMRRLPSPSFWTMASCPEASCAYVSAWVTEADMCFGVVKTAPPWNSMPMFRPRTVRPRMAVMVIRIEIAYQILRLPTKS